QEISRQMGEGVHAHHQADERRRGAKGYGERRQHRVLRVKVEKRHKQKKIKPEGGFHPSTSHSPCPGVPGFFRRFVPRPLLPTVRAGGGRYDEGGVCPAVLRPGSLI